MPTCLLCGPPVSGLNPSSLQDGVCWQVVIFLQLPQLHCFLQPEVQRYKLYHEWECLFLDFGIWCKSSQEGIPYDRVIEPHHGPLTIQLQEYTAIIELSHADKVMLL